MRVSTVPCEMKFDTKKSEKIESIQTFAASALFKSYFMPVLYYEIYPRNAE